MSETAPDNLWLVMLLLGIGSFLLRFSFLGIIGNRPLPPWILRHLRYTAVAVIPALVAPFVIWPTATGGEPDAARLAAAVATFAVGLWTRSVLAAVIAGAGTLYVGLFGLM